MRVNLLGSFEVITDDGRVVPVKGSKAGQVFALLLIRCNEVVSVDTLAEELWGERLPRSAMPTLQTYIYHLRRWLQRESITVCPGEFLITRSLGYQVRLTEEQVDAKRFERLVNQAGQHLDQGRPEATLECVQQALSLWRGPAFANVSTGTVLSAHAVHLSELRLRAMQIRIEAERCRGRYRECIPELKMLVMDHPLNETFHIYLIEALSKSGRRAEALQAFQHLRCVLNKELGVDPSLEAQRLQREVLNGASA